ncbi:hypothetical protein ACSBR2_002837 [Camellia fascicularis]
MTIVNLSSATATSGGWTKTRIFTSHLHTSRWFMVFASLLIMSVNGATYMFGLYSGDIKSSLGYDQTTLNLIGFFKDLGGNIGLISGLINEVMLSTILLGFSRAEYGGSALVVFVLLFAPLIVVIQEEFRAWKSDKQVFNDPRPPKLVIVGSLATNNPPAVEFKSAPPPQAAQLEPLPPSPRPPTSLQNPESCINSIFKPPQRGEDYTILQAVFSIDMLVLFISASCGIGGTLTAIDNLGQIGKSLGYPNTSISTFVSLMSIWNYLGRVVSGFSSEFLLTKFCLSRPLLLTVVLLISCLGHLLIAFGILNSLYFALVIIGFCFGAQWPLLFAIVSDIFGLKYYSTLFQFGAVASPVGAYLLNVEVAGQLYDKEALKQLGAKGLERQLGHDLTCVGVKCYRLSFVIITVATLIGCFASVVLVFRTRKFYRGDIYRKYREEVEVVGMEVGLASTPVDQSKFEQCSEYRTDHIMI